MPGLMLRELSTKQRNSEGDIAKGKLSTKQRNSEGDIAKCHGHSGRCGAVKFRAVTQSRLVAKLCTSVSYRQNVTALWFAH